MPLKGLGLLLTELTLLPEILRMSLKRLKEFRISLEGLGTSLRGL